MSWSLNPKPQQTGHDNTVPGPGFGAYQTKTKRFSQPHTVRPCDKRDTTKRYKFRFRARREHLEMCQRPKSKGHNLALAKASFWLWLSYMCHICSTGGKLGKWNSSRILRPCVRRAGFRRDTLSPVLDKPWWESDTPTPGMDTPIREMMTWRVRAEWILSDSDPWILLDSDPCVRRAF